ncbi:glutathione S-transferase family protein [Ahrensia sp. R2A130]|uniref:glutathione S-transferase family protein n=1 Tax=Ahrensia sp. R2A130 TaxID=744979 RepID=UPI0001E09428|nr:glutathione S-transferase family protein [Ahrensia sp. R2A130]EFL90585.1 beta-etherase [Ahrensia sp. R2A130]
MTILHYELCGADSAQVFSPHCWKSRMALEHKGLDYKTVAVPFTQVATLEGGDARRVPVIRDGDTVVEDSLAIAEYLDANYPDTPSVLGGPEAAALTRFVGNWSQRNLHPAVSKLAMLDIHDALADTDKAFFRRTRENTLGSTLEEFSAKFPKDGAELGRALEPFATTLQGQPYLGGKTPLFADYIVFGALQWLRVTSPLDVLDKTSPVGEWFERLLDMYDGVGRSVPKAA